jgi:hypothetical protein
MSDKKESPKKAPAKIADEVLLKCTVLKQADGKPVLMGTMWCGSGAKTIMTESKAKAAEKLGWVKINGIA